MSDVDHDLLYRMAEAQSGYFTSAQAAAAEMDPSTLRYHARPGGRFEPIRRGLYRLKHFPASPSEHIMAAWLPLRDAGAIVSHDSALELQGLSDVIPSEVHLLLPRSQRGQRRRPGVLLHTVESHLDNSEVRWVAGVPVTSPERTIVDCAVTGVQPEQVELAIEQALARGLTTVSRLRGAASGRSRRVRDLIESSIARHPA